MRSLIYKKSFIYLYIFFLIIVGRHAFSEQLDDKKIFITSDSLYVDMKENCADFRGNVNILQGTANIEADSVKVYYEKDSKENSNIKRLEALGNVIINLDGKLAMSEKAVYETKESILTLSGPESKIAIDGNSLIGNKITIYRKTDRITVENSEDNQVKGLYKLK